MENINGTGLLPDPIDDRDYKFEQVFGTEVASIDWSKEFRLPEPPDHNQGNSDSCVSYATSYLHWQLNKNKDYSRRDLFSRIALVYGAYLRDGVKQICKTGQQTKDECPDPQRPTSANMRIKSQLPDTAGMDDLEANYFGLENINPDSLARAVRDYQGCIFGVNGDWGNWANLTNPKPPTKAEWAHALYAFGYHMHDNQKCIIAKSSWCDPTHNEHHIKQDYFTSGNVFSPWCVIPKKEMTKRFRVNDSGKMGIAILEGFTGVIQFADTPENYEALKTAAKVTDNDSIINIPSI